jgi:hypothetical protein
MEGHNVLLDPPRIQLALHRSELRTVARFLREAVAPGQETWGQLAALATWLDAFAALGDRDRASTPLGRCCSRVPILSRLRYEHSASCVRT